MRSREPNDPPQKDPIFRSSFDYIKGEKSQSIDMEAARKTPSPSPQWQRTVASTAKYVPFPSGNSKEPS